MSAAIRLGSNQLEELANLIAMRLQGSPPPSLDGGESPGRSGGLVTAAELARELGTSRRFVYEHASELGAERLSAGSRPRLRFDLEAARAAMHRYGNGRSQAEIPHGDADRGRSRRRRTSRLPRGLPKPGSVLVSRGARATASERREG